MKSAASIEGVVYPPQLAREQMTLKYAYRKFSSLALYCLNIAKVFFGRM